MDYQIPLKLIWIVLISTLGSTTNYLMWKVHKKRDVNRTTLIKYSFFGAFTGLLLSGYTDCLEGVGWLEVIPISAIWGAQSEYFISLYLNRNSDDENDCTPSTTRKKRTKKIGPVL